MGIVFKSTLCSRANLRTEGAARSLKEDAAEVAFRKEWVCSLSSGIEEVLETFAGMLSFEGKGGFA
jgi:hypothetical protein